MSAPHTLLLVEDNPGDAGLVRAWLDGTCPGRFRIEHVDRLETACERDAEELFDAAILDLGLPDSHGVDTVTRFRRARPKCPLVVLTGDDDDSVAVAAVGCGADELLSKEEATAPRLASAIERAMARRGRREGSAALSEGLRRHLLLVEHALDSHPDALVVFEQDGTIRFANIAARALLGLRSGGEVPAPLLQDATYGWSGTIEGREPGDRPRKISILRRPMVSVELGAPKSLLLARVAEPGEAPLDLDSGDALCLLGGADALVERAAELMQRTAALAASTADVVTLPLTAHSLALDLTRLALALKEAIVAASGPPTRAREPELET